MTLYPWPQVTVKNVFSRLEVHNLFCWPIFSKIEISKLIFTPDCNQHKTFSVKILIFAHYFSIIGAKYLHGSNFQTQILKIKNKNS